MNFQKTLYILHHFQLGQLQEQYFLCEFQWSQRQCGMGHECQSWMVQEKLNLDFHFLVPLHSTKQSVERRK
jgi:hypothetical protein